MKQTALEWFIEVLIQSNSKVYISTHQFELSKEYFESIVKEAKAMEQEQIKDAHYKGRVKGFDEGCKYTALN